MEERDFDPIAFKKKRKKVLEDEIKNEKQTKEQETEKKSVKHKETKSNVPIDRGWAWVVLAAASMEMLIVIGFIKCLGIFYIQFQKKFNTSSSAVSLITTTQNITTSIASLLTMTIGLRVISCRASILIGSAVLGIGFIISSGAEDIRILYFSQGVLYGIGFAFVQPPVVAIIATYFDKRRGLANNFAQIGAGVGGLAFAPMLTKLFDEYGFSGTMLIAAGFHLNILVAGALMRPIEYYTDKKKQHTKKKTKKQSKPKIKTIETTNKPMKIKNRRPRTERVGSGTFLKDAAMKLKMIKGDAADDDDDDGVTYIPAVSPLALDNHKKKQFWKFSKSSSSDESLSDDNSMKFTRLPVVQRSVSHDPEEHHLEHKAQIVARYRTSSLGNRRQLSKITTHQKTEEAVTRSAEPKSNVTRFASYEFVHSSMMDLALSGKTEILETDSEQDAQTCSQVVSRSVKRVILMIFDVSLLKNPIFIVYLVSASILGAGNSAIGLFVAPYAKDLEIDDIRIGLMMSLICGIDLLARVVFGFVSDFKWLRRSTLLALSSFILGASSFFLQFMTSFATLMIYTVLLGIFNGVFFALYPVVIVDYLSLEKLKPSLGFCMVFQSISVAIVFAVIGVLRDSTGSYIIPYYFIGSMLVVGSGLTMLLPVLEKRQDSRDEGTEKIQTAETA